MSNIDLDRMLGILRNAQEGTKTTRVTPVQPPPEQPFKAKNGFRCNVAVLKNIQQAVALVVSKAATFELSKEGFAFRSMDATHISMCDIFIPAKSFDKFSYERDEPTAFVLPLGNKENPGLKGVLGRADASEIATFELVEGAAKLSFYNGATRNFVLNFDDEDTPQPPGMTAFPDFKDTSKIWMLSEKFRSIIKDIKTSSASIGIRITETEVQFFGADNTGKEETSVTLPRTDLAFMEVAAPTVPVEAAYPIDLLQPMVEKVHSEDVVLDYSTNMPIRVRLGLGIRGGVMATFLLACRKVGDKKQEAAPDGDSDGSDEDGPEDDDSTYDDENGGEPVEAEPEQPAPAKPSTRKKKK